MEYTSIIADMLHRPNHSNYSDTCYRSDQLTYRLEDNTLYYLQSIWCRDFRNYLEGYGITIPENKRLYVPIAKLENEKLIGYNTQYANMGNRFLEMGDSVRECHYPNLYLVEVGNHPYPKVARYHHQWTIETYHRDCHQLLNPPSDPKDFFREPNSFTPRLPPS